MSSTPLQAASTSHYRRWSGLVAIIWLVLLSGCTGTGSATSPAAAPATNQPSTESDNFQRRSWRRPASETADLHQAAIDADIPVQAARAKFLGPSIAAAQHSLALKLWLIDNARYSIDLNYYIFKRDLIGMAMLGALCNAVQRGVDVRVTVDSLGSISPGHTDLRALQTCADQAGLQRNADGQLSERRARVQVVIFNALTRFNFNRRSHDKLLIIDALYPAHATVITGGRNISLDYYGLLEDGSTDQHTFRDSEIVVRPASGDRAGSDHVGTVASHYYDVLFNYPGNRYIEAVGQHDFDDESLLPGADTAAEIYAERRQLAASSLATVNQFETLQTLRAGMPAWFRDDWRQPKVRLAHKLDNLTNDNVVSNAPDNKSRNPNSILNLINEIGGELQPGETSTIVSPYLFLSRHYNAAGEQIHDEADDILDLLKAQPDAEMVIITNSVLTSDNFFTQAVIDMDTAPRLLLSTELREQWLSSWQQGDLNPALVDTAQWRRLIDHPRIHIYETGGLDSTLLGGATPYGKMHAKFITGARFGFIGTSNFDYRSRLFNNEMGYFFDDPELLADLEHAAKELQAASYRWGSPEWLALRRAVVEHGGRRGISTRWQRSIYKTLTNLGLIWQF